MDIWAWVGVGVGFGGLGVLYLELELKAEGLHIWIWIFGVRGSKGLWGRQLGPLGVCTIRGGGAGLPFWGQVASCATHLFCPSHSTPGTGPA